MFYPRGGSAQVARYLSRALVECGWEVVLASGSLGSPGEQTHAATFFEGLHVEAADYTPALERFGRGEDQLVGPVPFHGSFEDRDGAPDPVFAALGPEQAKAQVSAWEGVFERAGFGHVDVIQPDVTRCGGLSEALKIARAAERDGIPVVPHAWKSGVIKAASLHLNAVLQTAYFQEYCVAETPVNRLLTRERMPVVEGFVDVPDKPGLGIELDPEILARYAIGTKPLPVS